MRRSHALVSDSAAVGADAGGTLGSGHLIRPRVPHWRDTSWTVGSVVVVLIAAFIVLILVQHPGRFAVFSGRIQIGVESASTLARLFAALVLFLFPRSEEGDRLRWVAGGLLVLGLGSLVFGYIGPLFAITLSVNALMYAGLAVWTAGGLLILRGLVPRERPAFSPQRLLAVLFIVAAAVTAITLTADHLPGLVHGTVNARDNRDFVLPGLTGWHWALSLIPIVVGIVAILGAARHIHDEPSMAWLLVALLLFTFAQIDNAFWPATFLPVITMADLLRLAVGIVLAGGAFYELRSISAERSQLLESHREEARRLAELNVLKSNFTAMVAHELGTPLAAIRLGALALASRKLPEDQEDEIVLSIKSEAEMLTSLVTDVQTAARAERDDFSVRPRPVPLNDLITAAAAYARTLPGNHPISLPMLAQGLVWADPDRVIQVLRNLLSNAAKYSPEGTPIELRVEPRLGRTRIEVVDAGYGIAPEDLQRVLEKFGRGRDQTGQNVPGVGLGLYLSRRIVQAHGSDITVESALGKGSIFGFDLEVVL